MASPVIDRLNKQVASLYKELREARADVSLLLDAGGALEEAIEAYEHQNVAGDGWEELWTALLAWQSAVKSLHTTP